MAESPDPLPRRFGRYLLFDRIGEGGMARIYLARTRTELGAERLVVVKQILPLLAASQEFSRMLVEEAKLAAQLTHGNVAQVIDLGREDDVLYIAMEYVEGFDLRDLLGQCSKRKVPLPIEFGLFVVLETLRGLDYAHRKRDDDGRPLGVVHRDVSPSNVLVSFEGEVKLCDFGIARAAGLGGDLPEEAIQGKAGYMAPEVAAGRPADARADVFAAGVILWELLAGRRLHRGVGGKPPTIEQARAAEIPPLPPRGYPDEERLHAVVQRALARQPEDRHASAEELRRELEAWVVAAGLVASPLRFGEWLLSTFGEEILATRRARERGARALELGPPAVVTVISTPAEDDAPVSQAAVDPAPASLVAVTNESVAPAAAAAPGFPRWALAVVAAVLVAAAVVLALR
ncbi:MAG: serine/threonine protein kinase [Polyangiaceae bacterium]|nr:serine/threonine protein kinase [Polyangiaceae bacterium]